MNKYLRPSAVPLITNDPFFSVWSGGNSLCDGETIHWTGRNNGMMGMVIIDGIPFLFAGDSEPLKRTNGHEFGIMIQRKLVVEALTSSYFFEGGGISLQVEFCSPLIMDDLDLMSRPVSYITFKVRAIDDKNHSVKLYFDVTGEWCINSNDQEVVWDRGIIDDCAEYMCMGNADQSELLKEGDVVNIEWGYFYLVVPKESGTLTTINAKSLRSDFAKTGKLPENDDSNMPRAVKIDMPVMACVYDLEIIGEKTVSRYLILAYNDIFSVEYFGEKLPGYWRKSCSDFDNMISKAVNEYDDIMVKCHEFNERMMNDARKAGGQKYADLLNVAYRQSVAAHKLVMDNEDNLLFLSKECNSNGCIGTVDVSYPSMPLFLAFNCDLVKGMLNPVFAFARKKEWKFEFAPHDVGCYPKANGQVYGKNEKGELALESQMPVEECGNILIMTAAICTIQNSGEFAEKNWDLLSKWANYLIEYGMDPGNQLCTEDFAGHLAHNANLSIKAIIGIASYSRICSILGKTEESDKYIKAAREMAIQWERMASDGDHYKLAFDKQDTWSQKYNLIWDSILNLKVFNPKIAEKESAYYISKINQYGLPLDNRNTYTMCPWILWSATLSDSQDNFKKLIEPLWNFANETPDRVPLTDWHDTITGRYINFRNRSVVGGMFIKLLKLYIG